MITAQQVDECNDIELAYDLFYEYCLYHDYKFFSARPFFEEIAEALQWVYEEYMQGRSRSITLSLPPRSGKSYIISLFSAWWLGHIPDHAVMRNAANSSLFRDFSGDTRKIIESAKYKSVFPNIRLHPFKRDVRKWALTTSKKAAYFGAGTGGSIIGSGANLAIYDDLIPSLEVAMNDEQLEKINNWKMVDHNSRKEKDCPEIGIGTRWRKNDVIGIEIEKGNVNKVFKVSALVFYKPTDPEFAEFPDGRTFCEDVNRTSFYLKEKKELEPELFDAIYQQEPMDLKGVLFPPSERRYYDPVRDAHILTQTSFRLAAVDAAKGGGDFYALIGGICIGTDIYIHDIVFNTDSTELNEEATVEFCVRNGINELKFEGNGAWFLMGQAIRSKLNKRKGRCSVRIFNQETNKHTRILSKAGYIRNHFVWRSDWEQMPQYKAFLKNLSQYMKDGHARNDDAPDVSAELMMYYMEHFRDRW